MKRILLFSTLFAIFTHATLAGNQFPILKGTEIEKPLERFLHTWLVKQDIGRAVAFVDVSHVSASLKGAQKCSLQTNFSDSDLVRKLLVMWLARDHGEIAQWGHGNPCALGFAYLPVKPEGFPERYKWEKANLAVQVIGHNRGSSDEHHVVIKFHHIPRDVLSIIFKKQGRNWKIVEFFWLVA